MMKKPGKTYLVIIPGRGRFPMHQWLRDNRQHAPEGMDPYDKKINSQTWRRVLRRNGWGDEETDTEVRLMFPLADWEEHPETTSAIALDHEGESEVETPSGFPPNEEDHVETPNAFALEQHLRDYIAKDIRKISFNGGNLKLFQDKNGRQGIEYPTDSGRIDILAVSTDDDQEFFVIELKLSRGSDQAIGQLMRYMMWVEDNIAHGKNVNGIIVAQAIDDKLRSAARMISSRVQLYEYRLSFDLNLVSFEN